MPGIKKSTTENEYDLLPKIQFKAHPKHKILVIIYSDPEKKITYQNSIQKHKKPNRTQIKIKQNKNKSKIHRP